MKRVCLSIYDVAAKNAGPKAKTDVEKILEKEYNFEIKNVIIVPGKITNKLKRVIKSFLYAIRYRNYDIVVIQTPTSLKKLERLIFKIIKNKVLIIHDIEGIRYQDDKLLNNEIKYYKDSKYVISHNNIMTEFLINKGIKKDNIITLELFDYLANGELIEKEGRVSSKIVLYPGNLKKSPFLFQLEESKMNFVINAYGVGIDSNINSRIIYKGSFKADDINELEGNLGLIWDGNFDESDQDLTFKNYTKYNNPHKLSCCLAIGIPVIVWDKTAISDFVEKNNIGYKISNLYDINLINLDDYEEKRKNVYLIGKRLRNGFYTKKAIEEVIKKVEK